MWIFCITDGAKLPFVVPKADNKAGQRPSDAACGVLSFKIANGYARMQRAAGHPATEALVPAPVAVQLRGKLNWGATP
jgi:hypothetical protein